MKVVGIQIKSAEAILVVLQENPNGEIIQTKENIKFDIKDPFSSVQVKQFRDK